MSDNEAETARLRAYAEARAYLDDLISRRQARLRIYEAADRLWVAHVEWNDDHPVHPIIGYTGAGPEQGAAIVSLARIVQDDRENIR